MGVKKISPRKKKKNLVKPVWMVLPGLQLNELDTQVVGQSEQVAHQETCLHLLGKVQGKVKLVGGGRLDREEGFIQ